MELKTRGIISAIINYAFENQKILETVKWVLESDDQVRSKEDLALGYMMGSLMNISDGIASRMNLEDKVEKRYRKKLEKKLGKEEALKILMEQDKKREETKSKGGRRIKSELTEEEIGDIKNRLIPMIARFREKIRQEEALGKVAS